LGDLIRNYSLLSGGNHQEGAKESMDATTLYAGVILGSIGLGFIVYGRKQRNPIALVSGVVLCGMPYFISNILLLTAAGIALTALPFLIRY
jgi:hypothetical protein